MRIRIYRGTHEIGGSCVELQSGDSRIIIDLGLPLVEKDGSRFDSNQLHSQSKHQIQPTWYPEKIYSYLSPLSSSENLCVEP